jgi:beta-glucanase (GH16 family)
MEARIQIPRGQGLWPAFWLLGDNCATVGWPGCGEIDIMENIGKEPRRVHGTVHAPGYSGAQGVNSMYDHAGGLRRSREDAGSDRAVVDSGHAPHHF